jgi:hypothetical protein
VRGPGNAVINVRGKVETHGRNGTDRLVTIDREGTHEAR